MDATSYSIGYSVYKDKQLIHDGSIKLKLTNANQAESVLKEQPLDELTEGKLSNTCEGITFAIHYAY